MANSYFRFKQFTIHQDRTAMKVTTDACLFGAWCAQLIAEMKKQSHNLLDIGTGTGLLSLMIAQKNQLQIHAVELDEAAAQQAGENVATSPWFEYIQVHHADIRDFKTEKQYDMVVSNPPFYEQELATDHPGRRMAHHSSALGLQELLQQVKDRLKEDGCFFLLFPSKREAEIERALAQNGLYPLKILKARQTPDHPVFRFMVMGAKKKLKMDAPEVISIMAADKTYGPEFTSLLRDYYLHL